jgi:16S rRNA (adenine1518-N6/adenine1519-N6)-dimethyltransferase
VVANIPYYITGALLKKFLSEKNQPSTLTLLVQKEVASRVARGKKESILSLSVKAYGMPRYVKTVPRGAFSPTPTVDSAILTIENVSRNNFKNSAQEKKFFSIVRMGFSQKRKLLKRNLEAVLGEDASAALQKAKIPENARAEDVGLQQWLSLAEN